MTRMIYMATLLVGLYLPLLPMPAAAAHKAHCQDLLSYPNALVTSEYQEQVFPDARVVVDPRAPKGFHDGVFNGLFDRQTTSMILLEELRPSDQIEHEIRMAREYARFVNGHQNRNFVFVASVDHLSTPVFDGLVVDRLGRPQAGISLKYMASRVKRVDLLELIDMLKGRLHLHAERRNVSDVPHWFRVVNSLASSSDEAVKTDDYRHQLARAVRMGSLFHLHVPGETLPMGREFRTVLDLRDSGYPFEFFREPQTQASLLDLLAPFKKERITLTLIWDWNHVVEVAGGRLAVYAPAPQ